MPRSKKDTRTAFEKRNSFQHMICTVPKQDTCRACKQPILSCYVHGVPTRLDPVHLSLTGEAIALVSGARTYEVSVMGKRKGMRRVVEMITRGLPAYGYIHPQHVCGLRYEKGALDERRLFEVDYAGSVPPF